MYLYMYDSVYMECPCLVLPLLQRTRARPALQPIRTHRNKLAKGETSKISKKGKADVKLNTIPYKYLQNTHRDAKHHANYTIKLIIPRDAYDKHRQR